MADDRAPILRDAARLQLWLHEAIDRDARPAPQRVCALSLELVETLLLALKDRDRIEQLHRADDALLCLRFHLRLLHERGIVEQSGMLHALEIADSVGRQLGGWLSHLHEVE